MRVVNCPVPKSANFVELASSRMSIDKYLAANKSMLEERIKYLQAQKAKPRRDTPQAQSYMVILDKSIAQAEKMLADLSPSVPKQTVH